MPPIMAPAYSMGMEWAIEFKDKASATRMTPREATMRGLTLSPNQLSTGTSQVSARTKTAKAPPIAARDQPCAFDIGSTNRFQPYCRLAIITMQTMPMINWVQRSWFSLSAVAESFAICIPALFFLVARFLGIRLIASDATAIFSPFRLQKHTFGRRPHVKPL